MKCKRLIVARYVPRTSATLGYCIQWPAVMQTLISSMAWFALDIFTDARMPCLFTKFTYYDKINIVIIAPFAIVICGGIGGCVWSYRELRQLKQAKARTRGRRESTADRATIVKMKNQQRWARERKDGSDKSIVKMGMWKAAPVILFIIDLIYPTLTRTLCQFFTCRDLASAGLFLEADYSVQPVAILQRTFLLS